MPSMRPQPLGCGNPVSGKYVAASDHAFNEAATVRLRKYHAHNRSKSCKIPFNEAATVRLRKYLQAACLRT